MKKLKMKIKNKKASNLLENILKYALWIILAGLLLAGLYYLKKALGI